MDIAGGGKHDDPRSSLWQRLAILAALAVTAVCTLFLV